MARNHGRIVKPLTFKTKWQRDLRDTIFTRDKLTCQRCGWKRGDSIPGDIRGLELDHIIARHNGGTHELSNLQTLCSRCNASKGAR